MDQMEFYVRSFRFDTHKEGWNDRQYPFSLPIVRHLGQLDIKNQVTFLVGENGTGKSTLMEALAVSCGFNPEGGSRNFNFTTKATHSPLGNYMRVVKGVKRPKDGYFLRAESFYNVASNIDDLDDEPTIGDSIADSYGGSLHEQSHGESFMALIQNRLFGHGLYLLDEPEAALSPLRQLALLTRMKELARMDSQFIIATHSPIILGYPGAQIFMLDHTGVRPIAYEDTDHYQLTKRFLNNREDMLRQLMGD